MARRYASRRRYASSGGSRRKLVWARTANLSPGQTTRSYDLLAPWRNAMDWGSTPGTTIRRIRMDVYAQTSSPVGEFINNMPILGIIVWSQDTNQADLLDPPDLEGRASDWMHWGQYSPYSQGGQSASYAVDVKSQRKLEEMRQTCWLVRDTAGMLGDDQANFRINTSVLLALP